LSGSARGLASHSPSSEASAFASSASAASSAAVHLHRHIINCRLGPSRQLDKRCRQASIAAEPTSAIIKAARADSRFRFEQIREPFGLGQVDASLAKARRVNSPGSAAACRQSSQRAQHGVHHRLSAMALIFNDIFACRRGWPIESKHQSFIDSLARSGSRSSRNATRRAAGSLPASASRLQSPAARSSGSPLPLRRAATGESENGFVGAH
jgi:hypothetical protein